MLFKPNTPLYSYEIVREAGSQVIYINYLGAPYVPNIAEDSDIMSRTIDMLMENPNLSRIVFVQQRNYSYGSSETFMLQEIANLYVYLTKQEKILSPSKLSIMNSEYLSQRHKDISHALFLLKRDPITCFFELEKFIRKEKSELENTPENLKIDQVSYIRLLEKFHSLLEDIRLIKESKKYFSDYIFGKRDVYYHFFRADIIPNFTFTRLVSTLPEDSEIVAQYNIGKGYDESTVTILKRKEDAKYSYHLMPPEYSLNEEKQELLNLARNVLMEHQPKAEEFTDPEKTRQVFLNVSRDLLRDLSESKNIKMDYNELNRLATILVRHTIGFGLIEVLLQDSNLQDIVLNAPISSNPVFLRHSEFDECITNIIPSKEDADSWAAKFRLTSGRPLDEANPVLDTDLSLGNIKARIAVVQEPLSPNGLAYAIRRHREEPWTLPLFVKNRMINSFAAGLFSFFIDGSRTILVAGTRSSGKCVDGNTLIQLSDGNIMKIKDLIGSRKKDIDDGIICNPILETQVKSFGKMKIENQKITDVWRRTSPKRVIKIRLKSGKEIITTKEHPYFVYENKLKNKRADELKISDLIASPRELNISGKDIEINLKNHPCLIKEEDNFFVLKGKTNSSIIKFPKKLTSELAEFIGMVIGDGHLDKTKLEFFNNNKELRERYISLIKLFNVNYKVFKSRTTHVVHINSRILNRVLKEVFEIPFGKKSDKVFIPQLILKSDNNVLSKFLRGYFDCDGFIPKNKRDIEIVSASKLMSEHLRLALLRFGITAFTKRKIINDVDYYRILIRGDFVNDYAKYIGFFHPMKKERIEFIISKDYISNTNIDTIPDGNHILRELRRRLRVSPKNLRDFGKDYWAYETNQYRVTRNWFKKLAEFYKKRLEHFVLLKKNIENLERFVNFDYKDYLGKFERIRQLLCISYISLAIDSKLSDSGLRKILQEKRIGSFQTLEEIFSLVNILSERIDELSLIKETETKIENIPVFINNHLVSYAQLSREIDIPETSLKYYCNGKTKVSEDLRILIESKLNEIKHKTLSNIDEAANLLRESRDCCFFSENIQRGVFLSHLKEVLNISNEELLSDDVSIQTISNFFNGIYAPSFKVLKSIINSIVKIFNLTVSNETEKLILEADELANSDIFWDEVINTEEIDKIDNYVYDLSVEKNHSFVANGIIAHNTSMLGALMLEIMPKYRIIVLEDTLELPIEALRKLKFDILRMKVRGSLLAESSEISADEGIRTSLRLGDSSLIVGEVRSLEAKALYEAMRVGALANVVAGTIHGASPYGVFDRVVNDLQVPVTSFKATDCIIVANPVKTPDGMKSMKRIIQLAEVRKHWTKDPEEEKGFVDLLKYNVEKDELEASEELINGDSETIKTIAAGVKGWVGNWDAVYDNILLRAKAKEEIVNVSDKLKKPEILESGFNCLSNNMFHQFSKEVQEEVGLPVGERVFPLWQEWLKKEARGWSV
jgi:type IV secretory pathway ATPase VirB11/archaellum biosynthesis ATPase